MPTRFIRCLQCGLEGEIAIPGLEPEGSPLKVFAHLGHNPLSGHMHYQCPSCEIVLLVSPMDLLGEKRCDGLALPSGYIDKASGHHMRAGLRAMMQHIGKHLLFWVDMFFESLHITGVSPCHPGRGLKNYDG